MFNYLLILIIFAFISFCLPQMSGVLNISYLYNVSEFYELGVRNITALSSDITLVWEERIIGTGYEGRVL